MSRLAIVLVVLVGLVLAAVITCVGAGWYFLNFVAQTPENVDYELTVPEVVTQGERFTVEVVITNTDTRPRTVVGVDMYPPFTEGVAIRTADPPWTRFDPTFFHSYTYSIALQPGEVVRISFECEALQTGEWAGDIDVCIDSQFSILSQVGHVRVQARPEAPPN